jgi:dihydroneopterin aldolase
MAFQARIGILPHEAEETQPIEVDLLLYVKAPKGEIDTHTILDYRHAYDIAASVINAGHIPYLEEAAESIAEKALALPLVNGVRVAVRKMRVALPGPLAFAEVAVERRRD